MKNAVVTGGGSGIGLAISNRLRADGYHVAVLDLNPSDAPNSFVADVTDRAAVDKAMNAIRASWVLSPSWSTRRAWTASASSSTPRSSVGSASSTSTSTASSTASRPCCRT